MKSLITEFNHYYSSIWASEYCQVEQTDCGVCCLAYLARRLNKSRVSLSQVKSKVSYSGKSLNIKQMVDAAKYLGLLLTPFKFEGNFNFSEIRYPAILHLKSNHYIVVHSCLNRDMLNVFDPEKGVHKLERCLLEDELSGYFIEASSADSELSLAGRETFGLGKIYKEFASHKRTIQWLIIISLVSQVVALFPIVITQHIVDSLQKSDPARHIIILLGLSTVILFFDFLLTNLRGVTLNRLRVALSLDSAASILEKLWCMPSEKITSKSSALLIKDFDAIHILRDILCNELISFVLNISSIFVSAIFLFYYLPEAALISVVGAAIYVIIKFLSVPRFIFLESEAHISNSNLQGHLYETLDQILSIKTHPFQDNRKVSIWNAYHNKIRNEDRANRFSLKFTLVSIFVFGFITIVSYAICFSAVILSEISLGAAFAFIAIQQRFILSGSQCIDGIHTLSMFKVSLDRLTSFGDIEPEDVIASPKMLREQLDSEFRIFVLDYPLSNSKTLTEVICPGELIMVEGKSGSGKSTFLKALASSFFVDSQFFRFEQNTVDGEAVSPVFCMVGQGDRLLSGTIEDNIVFFSKEIDFDLLGRCIDVCGLDVFLSNLEYGIKARITLAAAPFSGGEYQRVLLARALYSKPDILVIDEATSDLDISSEVVLLQRLKRYVSTLIVVSHKPEIQKLGSRILRLE